jgi:hypothetical protein
VADRNPALEAIRRVWWRAFDRVCYCIVSLRLSIHDRMFGPEPPTPADLKRKADHERLVRVFPVPGEAIEPTHPDRIIADAEKGPSNRRRRLDGTILSIRRLGNLSVPFRLSTGWGGVGSILNGSICQAVAMKPTSSAFQRSAERKSRARRVMIVPLMASGDNRP